MNISNLPKGLFKLKSKPEELIEKNIPIPQLDSSSSSLLQNDNLTVERFGFNSARENNGSNIGLSICLNRIYLDHKKRVTEDELQQAELKKPYKLKLHDLIIENEGYIKRIEKIKKEEIVYVNNKIDDLKRKISDIRSKPEELTGDKSGKASFYIGLVILTFLTVYLFIFYSSASYSSFFKEFQISEIGIANSIFDPQALSKAFNEGFTELVLILTIPAVFLGLGYLIHKFQELKGIKKYIYIAFLVGVTFIFDSIIAYEICEKIYNIKRTNSFTAIPEYSLDYAYHSINFWLIIFAGFVVYLIWGLVFDFTIQSHEKLDKVRVAISNLTEEIKSQEKIIEKLNLDINQIEEKENKNKAEINKLTEIIEHTTIIPKEFEQYLFHFMQGWLHWMSANLKNQSQQIECENTLKLFMSNNIKQFELNS
jgi:hypothetical protein